MGDYTSNCMEETSRSTNNLSCLLIWLCLVYAPPKERDRVNFLVQNMKSDYHLLIKFLLTCVNKCYTTGRRRYSVVILI